MSSEAALGHLQPLPNDFLGAVQFGMLRGLEISGHRLPEANRSQSTSTPSCSTTD